MAANDDAISCGADFTLMELLAGCIGVDASSKNYIRNYETTNVAGSKAFTCGGSVTPQDVDAVLKSCFALDANGDMCIRIAKAT